MIGADFVDVRSPGPCEYRKKPSGNNPRALASHEKLSRTSLSNDIIRGTRLRCSLDDPSVILYKKQLSTIAERKFNESLRANSAQRFRVYA